MGANKRRISVREGEVFLDGQKILEAVRLEVNFTPELNESRVLKEKGLSRRWIGMDVTGTIAEYRSTPWLRRAVQKYLDTGATPEFTIQGIQDDKNSDYYDEYGDIMVTLLGAVFTGDVPLLNLDSEGDVQQDEIEFGAHDVIFG